MLLLRHYRGKVDIAEFVAIAAGHLCKVRRKFSLIKAIILHT
jgi:hypothetical protein